MHCGEDSDKPVHALHIDQPADCEDCFLPPLRYGLRIVLKEIGDSDYFSVLIIPHNLAHLIGKAGREKNKRVKTAVVAAEAVKQLFVKAVILMELAKLIYVRAAIF